MFLGVEKNLKRIERTSELELGNVSDLYVVALHVVLSIGGLVIQRAEPLVEV